MQLINGRTKEAHLRHVALNILADTNIPAVLNCGAECMSGYVFMNEPTAKTARVEYRVAESSKGWKLQSKSLKKAKWKTTLRGSWLNTSPLFEAIDRRKAIHKAQTERLSA